MAEDNREELRQGKEYKDSTANEEVKERKNILTFIKEKKMYFTIGAAVVLVVVIVVAMAVKQLKGDDGTTSNPDYDIGIDINAVPEEDDEPIFEYYPEELEQLRAYGYTADEVEESARNMVDAASLIEQAKASQEQIQKENFDKLMDTASPEYKQLLAMTWLGGRDRMVTPLAEDEFYGTDVIKINADYVKVPAKGNQLFLRVLLEDGTFIFMTVNPERWLALKDSGNIVVEYSVVDYNGEKYVTDIMEVQQ